ILLFKSNFGMKPHNRICSVLILPFLLFPSFFTSSTKQILIGFTPAGSDTQLQLESEFDTHLSADRISQRIERMSSQPNHLGSPMAYKNAVYLDSLLDSWGFDSRIEEFKVLLPTPVERLLEMTEPSAFRAGLSEPPVEGDATSGIREGSLPPYNAYSADGDVTAELV